MYTSVRTPTGALADLVALAAAFVGPVRKYRPGRAYGAVVRLHRCPHTLTAHEAAVLGAGYTVTW